MINAPRPYRSILLTWALVALGVHLGFNAAYGYARDELYFIDCAKHLAWGYVDQPPLAVLAALVAAPAHFALWAIRLPLAILSAATVVVGCLTAAELGGRKFAQTLCGLLMALAPPYLAQGYVLSTEFLQPLMWTGILYLSIRLVKSGNRRLLILISVAFILTMYAKYTVAALVLMIMLSLILTGRGRLLSSRYLCMGAALAFLLLLPNAAWQWQHGWPMAEVFRGGQLNRHAVHGLSVESSNNFKNALYFLAMQVLLVNPFFAPIWIWGVAALSFQRSFAPYRFIAVAYLLLVCLMVALTARVYYLEGFYPTLFAAGAVAIERYLSGKPRWLVPAALVAAFALDAPLIVLTLPVLPLQQYMRYEDAIGLSRLGSTDGQRHLVNPAYADQLGWEDMTKMVAQVYHSLPPAQRAGTAIFADRYAYAGAIDFYGPRYGLPPVISPNNSYYLWGTRGYSGNSVIAVGATDYRLLLHAFGTVRQIAVYRNEYRWILEGPLPIYLCTHPNAPLVKLWPSFKYYGL